MAVKTDISKAYDRLEWPFIRQVFETLGFADIWTDWILQCISTVSYSFLIDNEVMGKSFFREGSDKRTPCRSTSSSSVLRFSLVSANNHKMMAQ